MSGVNVKCKKKKKKMSKKRDNDDDDGEELLAKLEIIGKDGWFLWKIFFLCSVPSILNGLHLTSYVYLTEVPAHWCSIPEFSNSTWTSDQILMISSPNGKNDSSCEFYNWDYEKLSKMNFSSAFEYTKQNEKPASIPCEGYEYTENFSSMAIDYDLVCDRAALKSLIQVSLSIGKFLGAFLFGVLSDKFGRKLSFVLGCVLYVISGPLVGFASNYFMVIAGRIGLGAASSGIYHSAFVILSEIASKKKRAVLGILYNMSYPIGQMIIPVIAYFFKDWRTLQIIISLPSLLILTFYWFLPESPRWLLLKGRKTEAAKIINEVYDKRKKGKEVELKDYKETNVLTEENAEEDKITMDNLKKENEIFNILEKQKTKEEHNFWKKLLSTLNQFIELLKYFELRSRLLIVLVSWCVCSLSYYALALNVDNFSSDRYMYGFLTGLVEVPSYLLPLPMLRYLGRRQTSISLFYVGGLALLAILLVPKEEGLIILIIASIGRLCASAVFSVVILHTSELFPTLLRNTAIGCCSTAAHVGSMMAPIIVDLLGAYAWYIPSTVCGVVTLLAGTMIFLLPETKNKPLPDTIEDILKTNKNDKTGLHQICRR